MNKNLTKIIKELQFYSPFRKYFFPHVQYNFTVPQLCFLCKCIEDTRNVDGAIAEIGCFNGATTVFLNKYMDAQNIEKKYYALDTFSGFVKDDIDVEVEERGKAKELYQKAFFANSKRWFDGTMASNRVKRVTSIKADINKYDLKQLGQFSFVLLDVDLYRPIQTALPQIFENLESGGIIVVDDCNHLVKEWDGAHQAFVEFVKSQGLPIEIVFNKLGIIRK